MRRRREIRKVEEMLDAAISGDFRESDYNETELSRVETKWKRFLSTSVLSRESLEQEKENVKSLVSDISHQTKTPVANIRLYTDLIERKTQPGGAHTGQGTGTQNGRGNIQAGGEAGISDPVPD